MKKLLVGLLVIGSSFSFASTLSVENNLKFDNIKFEVQADKIINSDDFASITYLNIRLEGSDGTVLQLDANQVSLSNVCQYLGHSSLVSIKRGSSRDMSARVVSSEKIVLLTGRYSSNTIKNISCWK